MICEREEHGSIEFALKLLWSLLFMVNVAHENNISHGNISPLTVLVEGEGPDMVRLAGWSNESDLTLDNAASDCRQVFCTIRRYVEVCVLHTPKHWIGITFLDQLLESCDHQDEAWHHTVQGIWSTMGWTPMYKPMPWTTMKISKTIHIQNYIRNEKRYLYATDIHRYMFLRALAGKKTSTSWDSIQKLAELSYVLLLKKRDKSGYIDIDTCDRITKHLNEHQREHDRVFFDIHTLELSLANETSKHKDPITIDFNIPYHEELGLIHLEYMWWIDVTCEKNDAWRAAVQGSLEVLGYQKTMGVYTPVIHLPAIASMLDLKYDKGIHKERRDGIMDRYTYHKHCLLVFNEFSEVYVGIKESKEILSERSGEVFPWNEFVSDRLGSNGLPNTLIDLNPKRLLESECTDDVDLSCDSSLGSELDDDVLAFPKRKMKPRVEEWLEDNTKRLRS
jgi:hypothetical protein